MDLTNLWLAIVALGAALINGAIGYGFSSITTPIALFWFSNKVLNPALVTVELVVNLTLLFRERAYIPATKGLAFPVILTLFPGVLLGTVGLTYLAVNDVKVVVYAVLLPMIVVQLLGLRRPLGKERNGAAVGPMIGFLYALTTISGPPLAVYFRNQGLTKNEFRCSLAQVRVAESSLTFVTYLVFTEFFGANLIAAPALGLVPFLLLPVVIGVPLGVWLIGRIPRDAFNRLVMGVDGLIVSFGLSQVFVKLKWVGGTVGDLIFGAMAAFFAALSIYSVYRLPGSRKLVDSLPPGVRIRPPAGPPGDAPSTTTGVQPETGPPVERSDI